MNIEQVVEKLRHADEIIISFSHNGQVKQKSVTLAEATRELQRVARDYNEPGFDGPSFETQEGKRIAHLGPIVGAFAT